jgi:hypothetical protein
MWKKYLGIKEQSHQTGTGSNGSCPLLWRQQCLQNELSLDLLYVPGFSKLTINLLLNPVGGDTHAARLSIPGLDGFADLELPFPPVLINLHKGKFNAFAVHLQHSRFSKRHGVKMPQRRSSRLLHIAQFLENGCPRPQAFQCVGSGTGLPVTGLIQPSVSGRQIAAPS